MSSQLVKCSLMVATWALGVLHYVVPSELGLAAWLVVGAVGFRMDRRTA